MSWKLRKKVLAVYRRRLIARLAALRGAQTSDREVLESNHGFSVEAELPAKALRATEQSVSVELLTVQDDELCRVKDALEQMGKGTYGICEECGNKIPLVRLDAVPDATRCVKCQRQWEREHGIWQRWPEKDNLLVFDDLYSGKPELVRLDCVCL